MQQETRRVGVTTAAVLNPLKDAFGAVGGDVRGRKCTLVLLQVIDGVEM